MTRLDFLLLLAAFAIAVPSAHATVFSGEVRALDAQSLFAPPSNISPVTLRYYLPEGTPVKKGDVVLRIDAGQAAKDIRTRETDMAKAQAKSAKEIAELEAKEVTAEIAVADAQAALDTAKLDAALPRSLVSALDYDRYHAALDHARQDFVYKQQQLDEAHGAIARRQDDAKLELDKLRLQRDFSRVQVETAELRAERDGVLVHGFSEFFGSGGRMDEGSSAFVGQEVGQIVGTGKLGVRAWVLEPDRNGIKAGDKPLLSFDALPGRALHGTITAISGAPQTKPEWGSGSYFVVDIDLADAAALPLKPGMSVRVDTSARSDANPANTDIAAARSSETVRANGEVYARETSAISPPSIEGLWNLTVTQMTPDGEVVKKGAPLVGFDGGEVMKQLTAAQSELAEKSREQEKLRLELAEKARTQALETADAEAEATKAQRKANQPEAYVPGIEFKKLVIARHKAERHLELARKNEAVAAKVRAASQQLVDNDVVRLTADVARLRDAVAQLNVAAPRDGTFLHASGWDGKKIDNGSQIWLGQSVGQIPDTSTLAVRASLPERDLLKVARGDAVRVLLDGGAGQSLPGHVNDIGFGVHSKSRVEPVPVVDLFVTLDQPSTNLKPGQPVRVEIPTNGKRVAAQ